MPFSLQNYRYDEPSVGSRRICDEKVALVACQTRVGSSKIDANPLSLKLRMHILKYDTLDRQLVA